LKSAIYGGLDGTITTFAVVAGVTGAALSPAIILILGFANLIGDGISMAIGDYLSTKAENEYYLSEREREEWEVDTYPQGEKREMVEIYMQKGMSKSDADAMVKALSKHKKAWVDVMMLEELGMVKNEGSPLKNALVTFASFAIFGFIPLAAYVFSLFFAQFAQDSFMLACALTALTLFMLGALKTKITGKNWAYCGAEMLAVGSLAAGAAYLVGVFLSGLA
jgi:VIT1/CCC1 family predicted Fe2+/Mn2+ transporter